MKISKNKYWQESPNWKNQNQNTNISFLDKFAKKINNYLENKFQIRIQRLKYHKDKTFSSRVLDKDILSEKNILIFDQLQNLLNLFGLNYNFETFEKDVAHFDEIYLSWKKKYIRGGLSYNNALFLFLFLKITDPDHYIESGVAMGFSLYIADHALKKNATIYAYDINLDNNLHKSERIFFNEYEITKNFPELNGQKTVIFYDDHMPHVDRLYLSKEKNIKYSIFDDDVSFLNLHSDGWPPLPTINMVLDKKFEHKLKDGFSWINNDGLSSYKPSNDDYLEIKKILMHSKIYNLPNLRKITGYENSSFTTFIEI